MFATGANVQMGCSVLRQQGLISCQELFVNRTRHIREHSLPVHWLELNQRTCLTRNSSLSS